MNEDSTDVPDPRENWKQNVCVCVCVCVFVCVCVGVGVGVCAREGA